MVRAAQVACPSKARGARIRVAVSHVQEGVPSAMFRRECVDLPLFRGTLPPGRRGSDSLGAVHVCMYTCVGSTCTCMYVCGSDSFAARRGRTYIHALRRSETRDEAALMCCAAALGRERANTHTQARARAHTHRLLQTLLLLQTVTADGYCRRLL